MLPNNWVVVANEIMEVKHQQDMWKDFFPLLDHYGSHVLQHWLGKMVPPTKLEEFPGLVVQDAPPFELLVVEVDEFIPMDEIVE